jgi:hypothetical protein
MKNLLGKINDRFFSKWLVCSIISDKKSVQYGIRFSYPIYISIVFIGILLENPLILLIAAMIAYLGIKLPLHPFDYIYNFGVTKLIGLHKIPGRGSELQVNSVVAILFNLLVSVFIISEVSINFSALAIIYALSSIFFVCYFLLKD